MAYFWVRGHDGQTKGRADPILMEAATGEGARVDSAVRGMTVDSVQRHVVIAFVAYEGPWFKCGGIAAVMDRLPAAVRPIANAPTIVITPFHVSRHKDNKIPSLGMEPVNADPMRVRYDKTDFKITVCRHVAKSVPWYFVKVDDSDAGSGGAIFAGERHPYDLPRQALLRDSLVFGQAVVQALGVISQDVTKRTEPVEWRLVMQDWQAAVAALAFAGQDAQQGALYLTLHNSYDEYAAPDAERERLDALNRPGLFRIGIKADGGPGDTILQRAFSLAEWPVFTVSEEFSTEFTRDVLQRAVMARHLQPALEEKSILGIDNGPFTDLAIPVTHLRQAAAGVLAPLQQWKALQKAKALEELARGLPTDVTVWGAREQFRRDDSPWIVMAGRDDPRQKGYDVASAAAEDYLREWHGKPGCAQFLFFPIPGDEREAGLAFLEQLAARFPEDVLVFIGFWVAGFGSARQGSAYGLMPSLYEPFGMANEFYLQGGCVGIGRATGGNLQQIVPLRATAACSHAVRVRANRYHSLSAHPTGILFREKDDIPSAIGDWNGINEAAYISQGLTRVEERRQFAVFQAMVAELRVAIEDGLRIYAEEPELYCEMLTGGVRYIQRTFSWHRAAREYVRYVGQDIVQ